MKKKLVWLRLLCAVLDFLIILIPIQFLMMGVFQVTISQADLFFKLLFAVYAALSTEYCRGTAGKYFGRIQVVDVDGGKPTLFYLGLRELAKSLYLIPYLGWGLAAVSIFMMLLQAKGRTIHDFIGKTRVVFLWELEAEDGVTHE